VNLRNRRQLELCGQDDGDTDDKSVHAERTAETASHVLVSRLDEQPIVEPVTPSCPLDRLAFRASAAWWLLPDRRRSACHGNDVRRDEDRADPREGCRASRTAVEHYAHAIDSMRPFLVTRPAGVQRKV
jgi:hypothetical protein